MQNTTKQLRYSDQNINLQKGARMNTDSSMPFSNQSLQALQEILKVHQSFVWHNPVTNAVEIQRLTPARMQLNQMVTQAASSKIRQ